MVNSICMAENNKEIYFNEFFEGHPNLKGNDLKVWLEEEKRKKRIFAEHPTVNNLTRRDVMEDRAKFYFLPFMINCYRFTRQHKLPYFAIPVSPTCMFYRDRLHLRNYMDTIHRYFFKCLDMCLKKGEKIMLLVEKRFHVEDPVDGGTQQLYNMLWDVDLSVLKDGERIHVPPKVILPPSGAQFPRIPAPDGGKQQFSDTSWDEDDLNPGIPAEGGIDLCRRTLWFQDDLEFLCKKYYLMDECVFYPEIVDVSKYPEDKKELYAKTAREFYFKIFEPKETEDDEDTEIISSDSDLDGDDDFDFDSTDIGMLDSTLDFEEDEKEMNKIIAFFAKMPKVTGLVQGMLDMMTSLTRVLPLVVVKVDDPKLKESLGRTVDIINLGIGKVLKICAYLGIKVQKKPNGAIGQIVKNRFKKDKKDFLEYEIDELNKSLDSLENVDDSEKPPKGQIPLDVKPNHLYPQRMPLGPKPPPPIVVPPEPPPVPVKPPPPPLPPKPPKPEVDPSGSELENGDNKPNNAKPEPPKIPSVMPEPPKHPPKNENGVL